MPTHQDYPWERDARVGAVSRSGGGARPPRPSGLSSAAGGHDEPGRQDPGLFLRSPTQRRVAWVVLVALFVVQHVRFVC